MSSSINQTSTNAKHGEGQRAGANKKGGAAAGTNSLSTHTRKQSQLAGVPLLHWRSDGHGNMDQFLRAFGPYAAQHFGLAGLFLDAGTEDYPPLLAPDIPHITYRGRVHHEGISKQI